MISLAYSSLLSNRPRFENAINASIPVWSQRYTAGIQIELVISSNNGEISTAFIYFIDSVIIGLVTSRRQYQAEYLLFRCEALVNYAARFLNPLRCYFRKLWRILLELAMLINVSGAKSFDLFRFIGALPREHIKSLPYAIDRAFVRPAKNTRMSEWRRIMPLGRKIIALAKPCRAGNNTYTHLSYRMLVSRHIIRRRG